MPNKKLGAFTVDVEVQPNGKYDVYISHENCSGYRYIDFTLKEIGDYLTDYIECVAESYEED